MSHSFILLWSLGRGTYRSDSRVLLLLPFNLFKAKALADFFCLLSCWFLSNLCIRTASYRGLEVNCMCAPERSLSSRKYAEHEKKASSVNKIKCANMSGKQKKERKK